MEHTLTLRHKTQTTHSLCNMESYSLPFATEKLHTKAPSYRVTPLCDFLSHPK